MRAICAMLDFSFDAYHADDAARYFARLFADADA